MGTRRRMILPKAFQTSAVEQRAPGWTVTACACIKGVGLLLAAYAMHEGAWDDWPMTPERLGFRLACWPLC